VAGVAKLASNDELAHTMLRSADKSAAPERWLSVNSIRGSLAAGLGDDGTDWKRVAG